jgi:hypothetical protein
MYGAVMVHNEKTKNIRIMKNNVVRGRGVMHCVLTQSERYEVLHIR